MYDDYDIYDDYFPADLQVDDGTAAVSDTVVPDFDSFFFDITSTTETDINSVNLQRLADNSDFLTGFLQFSVVFFVMFILYRFLKIFF